jgi:aspartyl-tRNA synthetase
MLDRVYCGTLRAHHVGEKVALFGWVAKRRDHGGVVFVDLRDKSGITQIVFRPEEEKAFANAHELRNEYVLHVIGRVEKRPQGTENVNLATGEIEVIAEVLEILNPSEPLPFQLDEEEISELLRLKYRYLDLRRGLVLKNLIERHRITQTVRHFLDQEGFIEVETPVLTRSTPEGARDYLVPSRVHPGHFYALPQSPQLFKQILMMGGLERYYQIARCFRDEDLRADRQPEFTQIDIETSFLDAEDIMGLMETMIRQIFKTVLAVDLPNPFPRLAYGEAMRRFGSDKPDLRNPLELCELTAELKHCGFAVFMEVIQKNGRVAALCLPEGAKLSRKEIDDYTRFVADFGAKGLAYIKVGEGQTLRDAWTSPIVKFLTDEALTIIAKQTKAKPGDMIFFGAGPERIVSASLGALRQKLGQDFNLVQKGWQPLWVIDFPMFEYDESEKRFIALHHPFTSPKNEDLELLKSEPEKVRSEAYDFVLNGWEVGGGSIRIHRRDLQKRVFALLGIGEKEAEERFGFLLEALSYGAPPHGGIAFGLDRLAAMITGADSIRDVIAFPKTQRAICPLTEAPSTVDATQLVELGLAIRHP